MLDTLDEPLTDILHDIEAALMLHPLLTPSNRLRLLQGLDRLGARLEEMTRQKGNTSSEPLGSPLEGFDVNC